MKFTKAFTVVAYDFTIPYSKRESEICLLSLADRIAEKSNVTTEDVMARNFADFLKRATPTVYYRLSRTLIDFLNLY